MTYPHAVTFMLLRYLLDKLLERLQAAPGVQLDLAAAELDRRNGTEESPTLSSKSCDIDVFEICVATAHTLRSISAHFRAMTLGRVFPATVGLGQGKRIGVGGSLVLVDQLRQSIQILAAGVICDSDGAPDTVLRVVTDEARAAWSSGIHARAFYPLFVQKYSLFRGLLEAAATNQRWRPLVECFSGVLIRSDVLPIFLRNIIGESTGTFAMRKNAPSLRGNVVGSLEQALANGVKLHVKSIRSGLKSGKLSIPTLVRWLGKHATAEQREMYGLEGPEEEVVARYTDRDSLVRVYRHVSAATSEAIAHSSKKKNDASFGAPLAIDLVDTLTRYLDASSEFKFQGLGMHDRPTLGRGRFMLQRGRRVGRADAPPQCYL